MSSLILPGASGPFGTWSYEPASPLQPTLPMPAGAAIMWSANRPSWYYGPALLIRRLSDSATMQIGFKDDAIDYAAIDEFAPAGYAVVTGYDMSGAGTAGFTQATAGLQPVGSPINQFGNFRPITFDPVGAGSVKWLANGALALNTNSMTVYMVFGSRCTYMSTNYYDLQVTLGVSEQGSFYQDATSNAGLKSTMPGAVGVATNVWPVSGLNTFIFASGATSLVDINGVQVARAAALSQAIGAVSIGNSLASGGSAYNAQGDLLFFAVYPTTHTAAQVAANRANLIAAFNPNALAPTNQIVYDGSSLIMGTGSTYAQTAPFVAGFGRVSANDAAHAFPAQPTWKCRDTAVSGRTLAAALTAWATFGPLLYDNTLAHNYALLDAPSNDIAAQTFTSTANAQSWASGFYTGTVLPGVAAIKAIGYDRVIPPTVISRNNFQSGGGNYFEDARIAINGLISQGASMNGYVCSDRASNPLLGLQNACQNATYFQGDHIHLTDAGTLLLASCDLGAIMR